MRHLQCSLFENRPNARQRRGVGRLDAPEAAAEQLQALREKTEQYCVVMQTLLHPPGLEVDWPEQQENGTFE